MMRVVLDTNVVVSGSLWSGAPRRVMQAVAEGKLKPLVSEAMLDELNDVLERSKFSERLKLVGKTAGQIVQEYAAKAEIIVTQPLAESVASDPDDDMFLACAVSGKAQKIVSGDPHLLTIKQYQAIPIVTVENILALLSNHQNDENKPE